MAFDRRDRDGATAGAGAAERLRDDLLVVRREIRPIPLEVDRERFRLRSAGLSLGLLATEAEAEEAAEAAEAEEAEEAEAAEAEAAEAPQTASAGRPLSHARCKKPHTRHRCR